MNNQLFMKPRLCLLMFLHFFTFGLTAPIMSLYLIQYLNFTGSQAGIILSFSGVAALISPIMGIVIADRWISVERLLTLCHLFSSLFMFILSFQTRFHIVLITYLLYMLSFGSTSGFVSSIVFRYSTDSKRGYGLIRMWGSIGWIIAGWLFSYVWLRNTQTNGLAGALQVSSAASLLVAIYALSIPRIKIIASKNQSLFPVEAFAIMFKPNLLLLSILLFLAQLCSQYYVFGMAPFLKQSGYLEANIMPLMSITQIFEATALGLLGYILARKSFKSVMTFGLVLNVIGDISLFSGSSISLVLPAIICCGLTYALFFTVTTIYFDNQCSEHTRSGVQQMIGILTMGFGAFFGNLLAGQAASIFQVSGTHFINYSYYWLVILIIHTLMLVLFLIFFKEKEV